MIFILWFVLAALVGVYANSKGRSGIIFFMISLILSPLIGIVIAVLSPADTSKMEQDALDTGSVKKCPACAELVKIEAVKCKHCNTDLPKPDPEVKVLMPKGFSQQEIMKKYDIKWNVFKHVYEYNEQTYRSFEAVLNDIEESQGK